MSARPGDPFHRGVPPGRRHEEEPSMMQRELARATAEAGRPDARFLRRRSRPA